MQRINRLILAALMLYSGGVLLAQDLSQPYVENEVIVRFVPGSAAADRALARNSVSPQGVRALGLVDGLELVRTNLDVPQAIAVLVNNPNVLYVEPNYLVQPILFPDDFYFNYWDVANNDGNGLQWGLHNVGQELQGGDPGIYDADIDMPEAWDEIAALTGNADGSPTERTVVAVIDTGTQWDHEDLAANIWTNQAETIDGSDSDGNGFIDDLRGWDFFDDDNDPDDGSGHGTHTAGTVAAVTDNDQTGVAGVCTNCLIMAIRFLGPNGGSTADAISSLNYAVANGATVSNNSWGGGGFSQGLEDAIAAAGAAGHIFVAAAGNSTANTDLSPHYPSSYNLPNIISVAATTNTDQRASFSNYGAASVDLGAPGVKIASTYMGDDYWWNNGTSMAAPHVTGVVALLQALNQELSWGLSAQDIVDRVLASARPAQSMVGLTVTGGILNAYNAIAGVTPNPIDPPNEPGMPTGFSVLDGQDGTAQLSWVNDSDATHYLVYREKRRTKGKNKGSWSGSTSYQVSESPHSDASGAGEFRYRIAAANASGTSPMTSWVEVIVTDGGGSDGGGGGGGGSGKCHPKRGC